MPIKAKLAVPIIIGLASILAGSTYWYFNSGFHLYLEQIATRASNGQLTLTEAEIDWYQALSPNAQHNFHQQLKQKTHWQTVTKLSIPQTMAKDWANQNHLMSQWYLATQSTSEFERRYWLKILANNQHETHFAAKASFELAQLSQQDSPLVADTWYQKTLSLNQPVSLLNQKAKFEYAKFLIKQGKPEPQWAYLINSNPVAQDYIQTELATFKYDFNQVLQALNLKIHQADHALAQCRKPIQLLASNYQQLQIIRHSLQALLKLDFFIDSGFCISGQYWSKNIPKQTPEINNKLLQTTYWLIESPQLARAYRQGQFIFMPGQLNTQVMGHELAHWLGFEDEYALNLEKANQRCALTDTQYGKQLGLNLIVIKADYYFNQKTELLNWMEKHVPWYDFIQDLEPWISKEKLGFTINFNNLGQGVGFYQTQTCEQLDLISLKPINNNTFMQNHEYYIPNLYKKMIYHSGSTTEP